MRSGPQISAPRSLLSFRLESSQRREKRPGAQRKRKGIAQFQMGKAAPGKRLPNRRAGEGLVWCPVSLDPTLCPSWRPARLARLALELPAG